MKSYTPVFLALSIATGCAHEAASDTHASETTVSHFALAGDSAERATCAPATKDTHFFYGPSGVEKRVIERHRCGVVELRVVDRLDIGDDTRVREIFRDVDHDGAFEHHFVQRDDLRGSLAELARNRVSR